MSRFRFEKRFRYVKIEANTFQDCNIMIFGKYINKYYIKYGLILFLGLAKAGYGKSGCQTLAVFKPEHQGLHGRKITGAKTDSHDEAIAYIDAQQRYETSRMCAAVPDKETGTGHTCCKADRSDQ